MMFKPEPAYNEHKVEPETENDRDDIMRHILAVSCAKRNDQNV